METGVGGARCIEVIAHAVATDWTQRTRRTTCGMWLAHTGDKENINCPV